MRLKVRFAALLSGVAVLCSAADKDARSLTLTALAYRVIPHEQTSTYQTPGQSNTTCWGSGTYLGSSVNATVNCSTVTTPPQQRSVTVRQIEVFNQLEADGMVYTIRCTANWIGSNCAWLVPGERFEAEIKETTIWVLARQGGNLGKAVRIKFQLLDLRPKPAPLPSATSRIPDRIEENILSYLGDRLHTWTDSDARKALSNPVAHRYAYGTAQNIVGDIYSYADPTNQFHHIELAFDSTTKEMTNVYLFPSGVRWDAIMDAWGGEKTFESLKNPDGTVFKRYSGDGLKVQFAVLVDDRGYVKTFAIY